MFETHKKRLGPSGLSLFVLLKVGLTFERDGEKRGQAVREPARNKVLGQQLVVDAVHPPAF